MPANKKPISQEERKKLIEKNGSNINVSPHPIPIKKKRLYFENTSHNKLKSIDIKNLETKENIDVSLEKKSNTEDFSDDCRKFSPETKKQSIGYGFINHKACEFLFSTALDANEYRLILFLIRETWGWKITWLDISGSMASKKIGWNKSQFWRTMKQLKNKNLVLSSKMSNSKSNFYCLNPDFFGETPKLKNIDIEQLTEINNDINSQQKNKQKEINNNENSQVKIGLTKFINQTQIVDLETRWLFFLKQEREIEEKKLIKLFSERPDESEIIFEAFKIIIKEQQELGKIISPISVLETHYTIQYREKAIESIASKKRKLQNDQLQKQAQTEKEAQEQEEARRDLILIKCFEDAFPDLSLRERYIEECARDPKMRMLFSKCPSMKSSYAINHWKNHEGAKIYAEALKL